MNKKTGLYKYAQMVLGIGLIGLAFSILSALLLGNLMEDGGAGFGSLVGGILGLVVGYPVGTVAGIYIFKRFLKRRGSLLLGAVGCFVAVVLTIGLAEPLNLNLDPNILFALFFLLVPVLGTVGFYLRGR